PSVQAVLSNTTASSRTLSLPQDYQNYSTFSLAPGESRAYGTFTQPASTRNIGLRNLMPLQIPVVSPPSLSITPAGSNLQLHWASILGLQYQPQWTSDFIVWNSLTNIFQPGTGSNMTYVDFPTPAQSLKFY